MFLKEFVDDTPWMHLDIAGTAWEEENKSWIAKGPTGIAVRSLVEFVHDLERFGAPTDGSGTQGSSAAKDRSEKGVGL